MKQLAVVICTYNRPDQLPAALAATQAQTAHRDLDVVVVDDGSAPPVDEAMVTATGARLVRHERNLGLGRARNTGIEATDAPLVAFTDDDCRPCPEWAEALVDAYGTGDWAAVGGPVEVQGHDGLLARYYLECPPVVPLEAALGRSRSIAYRAWLYAKGNVFPPRPQGTRTVFSLAGANMSFRREALAAVGGFDPGIRFGGDDEEICQRLRQRFGAACLVVTPAAAVMHDYDLTVLDLVRRAFRYGAGNARNVARHDEWKPTLFPVPLVALLLLGLARARPRAALAAAAVPVVMAPRWPVLALRARQLEPLVYAYLQALQETASNAGYLYAAAFSSRKARSNVP